MKGAQISLAKDKAVKVATGGVGAVNSGVCQINLIKGGPVFLGDKTVDSETGFMLFGSVPLIIPLAMNEGLYVIASAPAMVHVLLSGGAL